MVKRSIWQYSMFQIPALLSVVCLVSAGVVILLEVSCSSFWSRLFLGMTWIALMWMLVLPLDNLLRVRLNFGMDTAGRFAICHAVLWSLVTPLFLVLLILPPLRSSCSTLPPVDQERVSLDWAEWRANIWNEMFFGQLYPPSLPIGSKAGFSFVVYRDGRIQDIKIESENPDLRNFVMSRIESLKDSKSLAFIENTQRNQVTYKHNIKICYPNGNTCGKPADPNDNRDKEFFKRPKS